MLWALPCSIVGLAFCLVLVLLGGSVRRVGHTFEAALTAQHLHVPRWARQLDFAAITLGHVILGQSHEVLAVLRSHERVHVRQYERLGLFFFLAYPASSLVAWLQGRCPYAGNRFEQEAVAQAAENPRALRRNARQQTPDPQAADPPVASRRFRS